VAVAPSPAFAQSPASNRRATEPPLPHLRAQVQANRKEHRERAKARDLKALAYALAHGFALNLAQDTYIEKPPVPVAIRTQMVPTLEVANGPDSFPYRDPKAEVGSPRR
jgi:hypothetical protein